MRGIHSWRTGVTLDAGSYRSNDASNYLGTYTFESLAKYRLGLPRSYTIRVGDPNIDTTTSRPAGTSRTTSASART